MIEHSTEYTDHNLQVYNYLLITILTTFLHGDYFHICIISVSCFTNLLDSNFKESEQTNSWK